MGIRIRLNNARSAIDRTLFRRRINNARSLSDINSEYLELDWEQRHQFWGRYAKAFRDGPWARPDEVWAVPFGGRSITIPIRQDYAWLDWDTAVSIAGNDHHVKQYYEDQITGCDPPDLFVDVGANYGTHSLLFLVHGISTLSVEPNPGCRSRFESLCDANGVNGHWHSIALGAEPGAATLHYPKTRLWLGSLVADAISSQVEELETISVTVSTLDSLLADVTDRRVLIKIDVEGLEADVIRGGMSVLRRLAPTVIFESRPDTAARRDLYDAITKAGCTIRSLEAQTDQPDIVLARDEFLVSTETNFVAIPDRAA